MRAILNHVTELVADQILAKQAICYIKCLANKNLLYGIYLHNIFCLSIMLRYCTSADMFTANPYSSQPHISPDPWSQQAASM